MLGLIVDFNPRTGTCDVKLDKSGLLRGVPVLNMYGAQHGSDLSATTSLRGAIAVLLRVHNQVYVLATVPTQMTANIDIADKGTVEGYGGDNVYTYGQQTDRDFSSFRPSDYLPKDKVNKADGGSELSLMEEGVTVLKASPLAQFILCKLKDLGRLVTRVFQHFTDFGEVQFTHSSQGRVGLSVKGGADFTNETHPSKANYTFTAYIGDNPNNEKDRLFLKVNNGGDTTFVSTSYDIDGTATFKTSKDHVENIGNDHKSTVVGNEEVTITGKKSDFIADGYTLACSSFNIVRT